MESKQEQHVVVIGNPFDGMSIHGPFDTVDDAVAYGEESGEDWWAMVLHPVESQEIA